MNLIIEIKDTEGKTISLMTAAPKEFKTGSRGFFANGKVEIEGKRYQAQVQLVEIGSKPKEEEKK
jgi:hypothetical protein